MTRAKHSVHHFPLTLPRLFVSAVLCLILAGCATRMSNAPVIERSGSQAATPTAGSPTPVVPASGPGYHTVVKGDTLYSIALEAGQDYREIAAWNKLDNPNLIQVGQVLRVSPPDGVAQTFPVKTGNVDQKPLMAGAAPNAGVPVKNSPSGEKRPYSDATLADLSKPDAAPLVLAAVKLPDAPKPPDVKLDAKPESKPESKPDSKPESKTETKPDGAPDAREADDSAVGWIWPAQGKVIEEFAEGRNKGVDIAGKVGDPVIASGDGKVVYAGAALRGYGNLVIVKHNNNFLSAYAHNSKILVKEQQIVKKGQKIAEMGDTDADRVELHFEIRRQSKPVDPMTYLPAR